VLSRTPKTPPTSTYFTGHISTYFSKFAVHVPTYTTVSADATAPSSADKKPWIRDSRGQEPENRYQKENILRSFFKIVEVALRSQDIMPDHGLAVDNDLFFYTRSPEEGLVNLTKV
jgi:hypothetical protein